MVGIPNPRDGMNKLGFKPSMKNLGKSKSPPPAATNAEYFPCFSLTMFFFATLYMQTVVAHIPGYEASTTEGVLDTQIDVASTMQPSHRYILKSDHLPNNSDFYPTLANGYIGIKLFGDTIFVSGLYNGKKGQSHRARIPSTLPYVLSLAVPNSDLLDYEQNMAEGIFTATERQSGFKVEQLFYAHQLLTGLLVTEVKVNALQVGAWSIPLRNMSGAPSPDITFDNISDISYKSFCDCNDILYANLKYFPATNNGECDYLTSAVHMVGWTKVPEEEFSSRLEVHVIFSKFPSSIKIKAEQIPFKQKFMFFTSVGATFEESNYFYKEGLKRCSRLRDLHTAEWKTIWGRGKLNVVGSPSSDRLLAASLYYLLSSFPSSSNSTDFPPQFHGVSPGGLSNGGQDQYYFGHVFWDQDFWIMPALLPFYPELVRTVLQYRIRNLPAARWKARSLGYDGAMYPWESAYTGYDVCPGEEYIRREIHVTGDIVHLLEQYVYMTDDWSIFAESVPTANTGCRERFGKHSEDFLFRAHSCSWNELNPIREGCLTAWDLLRDTAKFWQSKVHFNITRNVYDINDVMGPDEWHSPVNNSAFTNVLASKNLRFAAQVAMRLGVCADLAHVWLKLASDIAIPFDLNRSYHPEYDGFVPQSGVVKQADAIMLGFPLMLDMSKNVQLNDLTIYENATTQYGPAMTWGMFSINWLKVDASRRASRMYLRQLSNVQQPFLIWSEDSDGTGCTNFLTGIGAYLQSVTYGYFGLRLLSDRLSMDPALLPISLTATVAKMTMSDLKYRGLVLKITTSSTSLTFELLGFDPKSKSRCAVVAVVETSDYFYLCQPGQHRVTKRTYCEIFGI